MQHLNPAYLVALILLACALDLGSTTPLHAGEKVLQVYDVTDLVRRPRNFPAPKLGLDGLEEQEGAAFDDEEEDEPWGIDELVELIRESLGLNEDGATASVEKFGRDKIVVVALPERHKQARHLLGTARRGPVIVYSMTSRLVHIEAEQLERFGLRESSRKAVLVDKVSAGKALEQLTQESKLELVTSPKVATLARQKASVAVTSQLAYVSDAEVHAGVIDPVIATLQEGFTIDLKAKPAPAAGVKSHLVQWTATVAEIARPIAESTLDIDGTPFTLQVPEVSQKVAQGRAVVKSNQVLVIPGLDVTPRTDGRVTLVILEIEATNAKNKKQK